MKTLLCITLALASFYSHATGFTIDKMSPPRTIRLVSQDQAASFFQISRRDLPPGSFGTPMTVEHLSWEATHYPYSTVNETLQVCYYPYGDLPNRPSTCQDATPDTSGTSPSFIGLPFAYETQIKIHHIVSGSRQTISPAGHDRLILRIKR